MKTAWRCCVVFVLGVLAAELHASVGPIGVSQNGRYFVDPLDEPFFWLGDTQWDLFLKYSDQDAASICEKRKSQGFSVLQIMILGVGGGTKPNAFGEKPLLNDDPLTPNDRYFARVDSLVEIADRKDLVCAIGIYHKTNDYGRLITMANARRWAKWVGQRYRRFPERHLEHVSRGERELHSDRPGIGRRSSGGRRRASSDHRPSRSVAGKLVAIVAQRALAVVQHDPDVEQRSGQLPDGGVRLCADAGQAGGQRRGPIRGRRRHQAPGHPPRGLLVLPCRRVLQLRSWRQLAIAGEVEDVDRFARGCSDGGLPEDRHLDSALVDADCRPVDPCRQPGQRRRRRAQRRDRRTGIGFSHTFRAPQRRQSAWTRSLAAIKAEAFWIDPKTGDRMRIGSYPTAGQQSFTTPAGWEDAVLWIAKGAVSVPQATVATPAVRVR